MPEAVDYYMPILRWKRGEQVALQNLKDSTKDVVDPILVIEPIDYDPSGPNGVDPSFDFQLQQQCASLVRYWPAHDASVDLWRTDTQARYGSASRHFVEEIFDRLRPEGAEMRP